MLSADALQGLQSATWEEALAAAKGALSKAKGSEVQFIAGKLADAESLIALKVRPTQRISAVTSPLHQGLQLHMSLCLPSHVRATGRPFQWGRVQGSYLWRPRKG